MNIENELIRFERDDLVDLGIAPAEADAWRKAGFTTSDRVAAWWGVTSGPAEAERWRDAGFEPEDASEWVDGDFSLDEAVAWRDAGFEPSKAKEWRFAGFTHDEAEALRNDGYTAEDASLEWHKAGVDLLDLVGRRAPVNPPSATEPVLQTAANDPSPEVAQAATHYASDDPDLWTTL